MIELDSDYVSSEKSKRTGAEIPLFHNDTRLPNGEEYHGIYAGVGYPKIYCLYRYSWNAKNKTGSWTFQSIEKHWNDPCEINDEDE